MKTVSLQSLASERINRKFSESKKPYLIDTFLDPIFYFNKVNIFTAESRDVSALAMFNVITKVIKNHTKSKIYHVCLEENVSNLTNQYLAHYGKEKVRNLKNKNYEVSKENIILPEVEFIVIKNDLSLTQIKETIDRSVTRENGEYSFVFLEGIDKVLAKVNRSLLMKELFDYLETDKMGMTVMASIKTDDNLKGFYQIPITKDREYLKYLLNGQEYFFKVDVDLMKFYPTDMGKFQKLEMLDILNNNQISFRDKMIMSHCSDHDSKYSTREQKIQELSDNLILVSSRITIKKSFIHKEDRALAWTHLLVCDKIEFTEREYYWVQSYVNPQDYLTVALEFVRVSSSISDKVGQFFQITNLNKMKEYALEEVSYKKRQEINIPSPNLEGMNKKSGTWSNHPRFGYDLKKQKPLFLYGTSAHQTAANILVKYKMKNPNTHIYIGGLIDKSHYHLGDENYSKITFSSYNETTLKRLVEYLHSEYVKRSESYDPNIDADKILYLSEIDELSKIISFEDDTQYSIGLKLKQLIRQAQICGIYVIASSCIELKKESPFFNPKDEFFHFEKTHNLEEFSKIKQDTEFVLSTDFICNNFIGDDTEVEEIDKNSMVLSKGGQKTLVQISSRSKLINNELNELNKLASKLETEKKIIITLEKVPASLYRNAHELEIQILDLEDLHQMKKIL